MIRKLFTSGEQIPPEVIKMQSEKRESQRGFQRLDLNELECLARSKGGKRDLRRGLRQLISNAMKVVMPAQKFNHDYQ